MIVVKQFLMIALGACLIKCSSVRVDDDTSTPIEKVLKELQEYEDKNKIHGGLTIAKDGEVIVERAFGENTEGEKNLLASSFDMASIMKMGTATICANLVSQGKLNYDEKVVFYMPELLEYPSLKDVTVAHLLSNSSGIPDIFNFDFINEKSKELGISIEDYFSIYEKNPYLLDHFIDEDLRFDPGSEFEYSLSLIHI